MARLSAVERKQNVRRASYWLVSRGVMLICFKSLFFFLILVDMGWKALEGAPTSSSSSLGQRSTPVEEDIMKEAKWENYKSRCTERYVEVNDTTTISLPGFC